MDILTASPTTPTAPPPMTHELAEAIEVGAAMVRAATDALNAAVAVVEQETPQKKRFFIVWSPQGGPATVKWPGRAGAEREAMRLAKRNPGKEFFVFRSIARHGNAAETAP